MDYGPSHAWHRTHCLRYIIILVANDVMHFKTFVLRTPSVPSQMMSRALCLEAEKLSSALWVFTWCCRHLVALEPIAVVSEEEGMGSKLGCGQLFITEAEDNVTHNGCPWCDCTNVVCWARDRREETDTLDVS